MAGALEPHLVEAAQRPPGNCIASGHTEGPFIDTARDVAARGHVYLSVRWLESTARDLLGMVSAAEQRESLAGLNSRLAVLESALADAQRFIDATVEYEEAKRGFTAPTPADTEPIPAEKEAVHVE